MWTSGLRKHHRRNGRKEGSTFSSTAVHLPEELQLRATPSHHLPSAPLAPPGRPGGGRPRVDGFPPSLATPRAGWDRPPLPRVSPNVINHRASTWTLVAERRLLGRSQPPPPCPTCASHPWDLQSSAPRHSPWTSPPHPLLWGSPVHRDQLPVGCGGGRAQVGVSVVPVEVALRVTRIQ